MTTIPTHVESWDTIPRDLDVNDHSRSRGAMTDAEREVAERRATLGGGLTQVTYIDSLTAPESPEG